MVSKVHGASTSMQNLTDSVTYYKMFALSSGSVADPSTATGVNIQTTGSVSDESQKNFEVVIQGIGLRAMPVIMNDPIAVSNVADEGATEIAGEGYVWKFAVERADYFENTGPNGTIGPVGFLVDEMDGIVLPSAVTIITQGGSQNVQFMVSEF
jgi:hypothetical protein